MQAYPRFSFAVFIIHWMYWTIHLKDQWCSTCSKLMRYPRAEINGAAQRTMTHLHSSQLTNDGKDHHRHWHRNDLQESHLYLKHVLGPLQYTTSNIKPQAYLRTGKCCTLISISCWWDAVQKTVELMTLTFGYRDRCSLQARLATGASTAQVNQWTSIQICLRKEILLHRGPRPGPKLGGPVHIIYMHSLFSNDRKQEKNNCCNSQQQHTII